MSVPARHTYLATCTKEVIRRSYSGFPGELVLPVAVLLHPARSIATAAKTAKWNSNRAFIFSTKSPRDPRGGKTLNRE